MTAAAGALAKLAALGPRVRQLATRSVHSVTSRRYLVGAVLAWVLIVYLAAAPSEIVGPAPRSVPTRAAPPATVAAPAPSLSIEAPSFAATTPTVPSFSFTPLSFTPPPPAPPATPPLSCPFPIPQSQTTPFSPGIFLSFEGPLIELSGPFATYDIPTLGAIGPLVPLATPLVYISEPVLNDVTPNLSVLITDYVTIIDDLGLNSPQEQQYADEFEPYYLELLNSLSPVEQDLASSTAGQCLVLFENALAVQDSQENLQLPALPLLPSGVPPSSSSTDAAVASATTADTHSPFAQLVLPWSGGVPSGLPTAVNALRAKGEPVELELVDQPPVGQTMGGAGFSDFVAQVVQDAPQASAFQVDAAGTDPSGSTQMADLVHGLAAADYMRQPGQLIGLGVPVSAEGAGAQGFWQAFHTSMEGWQSVMVDFVGADLTPQAQSSAAANDAEAAATAKSLESAWSTLGGVPANVPLFGTVGLAGGLPVTTTSVQQQIASYLAALAGLHVGALGVDPGS